MDCIHKRGPRELIEVSCLRSAHFRWEDPHARQGARPTRQNPPRPSWKGEPSGRLQISMSSARTVGRDHFRSSLRELAKLEASVVTLAAGIEYASAYHSTSALSMR